MNYYKSCYGDKTAPKAKTTSLQKKSVQEGRKKSSQFSSQNKGALKSQDVEVKSVKEEKKGFFERIKEVLFGKKQR